MHDIKLDRKRLHKKILKRLQHETVSYLLGSHHLILSLGLLYNQYEWKLLMPAYQEYYHPCLDLGNTHQHKLQYIFYSCGGPLLTSLAIQRGS